MTVGLLSRTVLSGVQTWDLIGACAERGRNCEVRGCGESLPRDPTSCQAGFISSVSAARPQRPTVLNSSATRFVLTRTCRRRVCEEERQLQGATIRDEQEHTVSTVERPFYGRFARGIWATAEDGLTGKSDNRDLCKSCSRDAPKRFCMILSHVFERRVYGLGVAMLDKDSGAHRARHHEPCMNAADVVRSLTMNPLVRTYRILVEPSSAI